MPDLALVSQPSPDQIALAGRWTAQTLAAAVDRLDAVQAVPGTELIADGEHIVALDTAGAWVVQKPLQRLRGLPPAFAKRMELVARQLAEQSARPAPIIERPAPPLERIGRRTVTAVEQALALLAFIGESAAALAHGLRHPGAAAPTADPLQHPAWDL